MHITKKTIVRSIILLTLLISLNLAIFVSTVQLTATSHDKRDNVALYKTKYNLKDRHFIFYVHASVVSALIHFYNSDRIVFDFDNKYIEYISVSKVIADSGKDYNKPDLTISLRDNKYILQTQFQKNEIPLGKLSTDRIFDKSYNEIKANEHLRIAIIKPLTFMPGSDQSEFDDFIVKITAKHLEQNIGRGQISMHYKENDLNETQR
jgi:hypothetical protein